MTQGQGPRRRASSARSRLVLLVIAVTAPIVAFSCIAVWRYSVDERLRQSERALALSSRISGAVDRELDSLQAALEALATSPALRTGDFGAFDEQARAVPKTRGTYVSMRDRTGQQLINTSRNFGTPLPVTAEPLVQKADEQVFATGQPVISDLFTGTVTRLPLVLIDAPVTVDGSVRYALNVALEPLKLADLLASLAPEGWTVALIDRNDRVIARSREHQRLVGQLATPDLRAAATGTSGIWDGRTLEGTAILGAYTRSVLSGWRVAVGVPRAAVDAPMRRLLWGLAGSGALVLGLSVLLAIRMSRSLSGPLSQLALAARQLGEGGSVDLPRTGLSEADQVARALSAAGQAIREREAALRASEERFRAAVRAVEGVVWTNDSEGRMAGPQPGWAALTGQSEAEYQGYGWAQAVHPQDVDPTVAAWNRAVEARSTFVFEHRVRTADGEYRTFSIRAVPVIDQDGAVREWVGVHTDVTDERAAKAALAESEARLKAVFEAAPVGLVIAEAPDGRITAGNARTEEILGHSIIPSAAIGDYGAWSALHPDGTPFKPEDYPLAKVISGAEARVDIEVLYQRGDGREAWVRLVAAPIHGPDGERTGAVVAVLDIDAERRAQAGLQDLAATLERRVEQAIAERDRIWRLSTELMLVARFEGQVVATNPAWQATLGWSAGDLSGRSFMDLVHPDDLAGTLTEVSRLSAGLTTLRFENRYRHRDGSYRWLSWTAVPDAGMIHAIARDITAERQSEEALRRTEEKLRQSQKMEVVGQLTGGVAHDFNNLLTVVTGHLDMARSRLEKGPHDPRLLRNVRNALEGAQRAATLTHRLLAFSRQSPLRPEPVDLNQVVSAMSELIRRTIGENISVETQLSGTLWQTSVDPNQVESAILNLCVNARDAMPAGGTLTIETANVSLDETHGPVLRSEAKAGDYVMVGVRDTGTGMPPDVMDRVFEPFFTTKPVGKGTGLGLSQVYGFLSQSGGAVALSSEPGAGTRVALYFPRDLQAERVVEAERARAAAELEPGQGRTVLVVEDEAMVREFTVAALEDAGYRVFAAPDGPSGLALVEAHPEASLLFTDVVLAGPLNGRAVADEALRLRPGLKVLFTTGYTRDAIVHEGRLDDGVDLLSKPFTASALREKIQSLLG